MAKNDEIHLCFLGKYGSHDSHLLKLETVEELVSSFLELER